MRALLALLLLPATLFPQARDYWLKTERKGTAYAYEHLTITSLPDGNLRYRTESQTKMDVAGVNPQDILFTSSYIVDPDLRPLSFESTGKSPARETHSAGARNGSRMAIKVHDPAGPPLEHAFDISDVYFAIVLPDLIVRRAASARQFQLKLFDASDPAPDTVQVEILSVTGTEITASVKGESVTSRYRIGKDGQIHETFTENYNARGTVTTEADAKNITYLNTADGFTLTVHSRKSFPNVYQVGKAELQVRWKTIPVDEFRLEDNRQKVVRLTKSGEQFEIIVAVSTPSSPPAKTPPPRPEIAREFLGEDDFVKPQNPAIRKQAVEIAGSTTAPTEIVGKLLHWVTNNVTPDMIAETLTGPEVLAKRRGKCAEYSVLFASLARALGIPTRIALGVNYAGNWGGHMWNEVWLGDWVAVDPTAGTFVSGPSHIKFVDSATVLGTQRIRTKLIDNLEIEILDFKERAAPSTVVTGISGSTYQNKTFGCRISAPDDTWTLNEKAEGGTIVLSMEPASGDPRVEFALVLFPLPPGTEAKRTLDGRLGAIAKMIPGYKLLDSGETTIAGRKAASATFSQVAAEGHRIVNRNIILADGSNGYLFAWIVDEDQVKTLEPNFQTILASFARLEP